MGDNLNQMNIGQIFIQYLKLHRKVIILFLSFVIICYLTFTLWNLPWQAILYAGVICAFVGGIAVIGDFVKFYGRYHRLRQILPNISLSEGNLPQAENILEETYREMVHLLLEEKVNLVNEMTNRFSDMKEYYTIWAHQIKTPIAAMRLKLQREEQDAGKAGRASQPEEQVNQEFLRELEEELQRIESYVEMVLCYIRMDAASTDYVIRKYDLNDIVRQALRKFAKSFIYKNIRLEYEPLGCEVLTDEKWLLFVVEQVISNAIKYTGRNSEINDLDEETGTISITIEENKVLCIKDTGIGIAPEDLSRIFEQGYTGYNGRSDKKASGIGLYLCKRICNNLGHEIIVESEPGKGTMVRIGLERKKIEVE